jgi:hypothetical protein
MAQHKGRLPANKQAALVFYCDGWPECKKRHDAAKAVAWGYRNVSWMHAASSARPSASVGS